MNMRDPGETLYFHYASKTHPIKHYELIHGEERDLPNEIVRHLEGENPTDMYACHERTYGRKVLADGRSTCFVNGYKPYFQCKRVSV
jgi:hypothetical protein